MKIGNVIGHLLRMDVCTQLPKRGQYARLCIQVLVDQPLTTSIYIGRYHQRVLYEGINLLCYHCGSIGHSISTCAYKHNHTTTPNLSQYVSLHNTYTHTSTIYPTCNLSAPKHSLSPSVPCNPNDLRITQQAINPTTTMDNFTPVTSIDKLADNPTPSSNHTSISPSSHNPTDSEHGPWMLVQYSKNRKLKSNKQPVKTHINNPTHTTSVNFQRRISQKPIWIGKFPKNSNSSK